MNAYYKMMITQKQNLNSLTTKDDICCQCLLITFANILYPDQAWQNVGPDMNWYSRNIFFEKS